VPEIVEPGLTGFIVEDEAGALAAVGKLGSLSRQKVREQFDARFTARRVAEDYVNIYRSLAGEDRSVLRAVVA
jgi:glycosyltransferase involved in cell wall biosynthesis